MADEEKDSVEATDEERNKCLLDANDDTTPPPVKKQKSCKTRRGLAGLINQSNLANELESCSERYGLYSSHSSTCRDDHTMKEILSQLHSDVDHGTESETHPVEVDSRTDVIVDEDEDEDVDVAVMDAVEADCSILSEPSPIPVPRKQPKRSKKLKAALAVLDRVKNFVNTEEDLVMVTNTSLSEISPVSERNDILVKVLYKGRLFKYTMKRSDPFYHLKDFLCERIGETSPDMMLVLGDRTLSSCDTPNTVQLQLTDIIDCHIQSSQSDQELETDYRNPNSINICVQSDGRNSKVNITANRTEPLRYVFEKYAADRKVDVTTLKFKFDGDYVDPDLTPDDLDIESGDCIDAIDGVIEVSDIIKDSDSDVIVIS